MTFLSQGTTTKTDFNDMFITRNNNIFVTRNNNKNDTNDILVTRNNNKDRCQ